MFFFHNKNQMCDLKREAMKTKYDNKIYFIAHNLLLALRGDSSVFAFVQSAINIHINMLFIPFVEKYFSMD